MATEEGTHEFLHEGHWAAMYVFVALIPVVAGLVMAYSNWADRAGQEAATDVEMAARAAAYQRHWFPWRDAVAASASASAAAAGRPARTAAVAPPILPASFATPAAKKTAEPSVTVTITAPTPAPAPASAPVPAPARFPVPAAYPSRPARPERETTLQPYDDDHHHDNRRQHYDNSASERWGEGPYGYGSSSSSRGRSRDTPTPTRALTPTPTEQGFKDVPF